MYILAQKHIKSSEISEAKIYEGIRLKRLTINNFYFDLLLEYTWIITFARFDKSTENRNF